MKSVPEVTCVGEVLVDFIPSKSGVTLNDAPAFHKALGGEAANVAVGLAKLGTRTGFVGSVGDEPFGRFLASELAKAKVDTTGIIFHKECQTRLAFVSLTRSGDRDFTFWESHPAGEQLHVSDLDLEAILKSKIVNIGPLMLVRNPSRSTAIWLAQQARRHGCDVAFDPNLRLSLWPLPIEAKRVSLRMIRLSTLVRLNADEARFFTGRRDLEKAADDLLSIGPAVAIITLGSKGCYFQTKRASAFVRGFKIKALDTTGCGDGFLAGILHRIIKTNESVRKLPTDALASICRYANAVGALTALRPGGAAATPTYREVDRFLSKA